MNILTLISDRGNESSLGESNNFKVDRCSFIPNGAPQSAGSGWAICLFLPKQLVHYEGGGMWCDY